MRGLWNAAVGLLAVQAGVSQAKSAKDREYEVKQFGSTIKLSGDFAVTEACSSLTFQLAAPSDTAQNGNVTVMYSEREASSGYLRLKPGITSAYEGYGSLLTSWPANDLAYFPEVGYSPTDPCATGKMDFIGHIYSESYQSSHYSYVYKLPCPPLKINLSHEIAQEIVSIDQEMKRLEEQYEKKYNEQYYGPSNENAKIWWDMSLLRLNYDTLGYKKERLIDDYIKAEASLLSEKTATTFFAAERELQAQVHCSGIEYVSQTP
ncbi:MAG: hypothetical protein K0S29_1100 [Gammaproteobacteria bacterium]|jgi:hypothetical protein|nr:hypothetical protein [Gammaproteobacteria bacterium]